MSDINLWLEVIQIQSQDIYNEKKSEAPAVDAPKPKNEWLFEEAKLDVDTSPLIGTYVSDSTSSAPTPTPTPIPYKPICLSCSYKLSDDTKPHCPWCKTCLKKWGKEEVMTVGEEKVTVCAMCIGVGKCPHCPLFIRDPNHTCCQFCLQCDMGCQCWTCEYCDGTYPADSKHAKCIMEDCDSCDTNYKCGHCWDCCSCLGPGYNAYEKAFKDWGLPTSFNLTRAAADYYILYYLKLRGHKPELFDEHLAKLTTILVPYTDMVIGGELRHLYRRGRPTSAALPLEAFAPQHSDRSVAWQEWKEIRNKHGLKALESARDYCNNMGVKNGYGGAMWGNIVDNLLMYEEGQLPPNLFIDFTWGLEHNAGTYFNKASTWKRNSLQAVLDSNLTGDVETLLKFATEEVRQTYHDFLPN